MYCTLTPVFRSEALSIINRLWFTSQCNIIEESYSIKNNKYYSKINRYWVGNKTSYSCSIK